MASGGNNDLLALVNTPGALNPCFAPPEVPELGVSFACYDILRATMDEYEANLDATLSAVRTFAKKRKTTLMVRTELNGLSEANCAIDGAIAADGSVFIPAGFIPALNQLADLAIEGDVPAIPALGFPGFEGLNVIMRRLAADYDALVVDTFLTFKAAALQGGDLVTRDCVNPNDEGHAAIYDMAVQVFEENKKKRAKKRRGTYDP